jgi:hypothetical protein
MATSLSTIGGITAYRATRPVCAHDASTAARVGTDTIASVWECDDCERQVPFTDEDYAFCNAQAWTPRAPEGVARLTWTLMGDAARRAHLLAG